MKENTFEEFLESNVKAQTTKESYLIAIRKFNNFLKNDSFKHGGAKVDEVIEVLKKELKWQYNETKNTIFNYKTKLKNEYKYLLTTKKIEELSMNELIGLKKAMNINGDPLFRAISKAEGNGALSAGIGCLIKWKKNQGELFKEGDKILEYQKNRIVYGAPGTGKSYLLKKQSENLFENFKTEIKVEEKNKNIKYWVVGAYWDIDKTEKFLENSCRENGHDDKFIEKIKSVAEGDYIGIKSLNRHTGELTIKSLGRVIKNYNDGKKLDVEWLDKGVKVYENMRYNTTIHEVIGNNRKIFDSIITSKTQININPIERVTFYDGYTHGQFVGSYKPFPDEDGITYKYVPGPFLRQLIKAYKYPEHNFCLIIEEINRARADRVFGNIFQLLDRDEEGNSRYRTALSEEQKEYIKKELYQENEILVREILTYDGIYIPKNLYIWATMNCADQGVYHLDTAFKRRWGFEHIDLDENKDAFVDEEKTYGIFYQQKDEIRDAVTWNDFREVINDALMNAGIHEDRLLAPFFIGKSEFIRYKDLIYPYEYFYEAEEGAFVNKILMYLFDDVLRYKRNNNPVFNEVYKSFSKLKKGYFNDSSIFNNEILKKLNEKSFKEKLNSTFEFPEY